MVNCLFMPVACHLYGGADSHVDLCRNWKKNVEILIRYFHEFPTLQKSRNGYNLLILPSFFHYRYDYSWSRGRIQGGGDINTALGLLPDKLKTELALHVNLSVLKKVIRAKLFFAEAIWHVKILSLIYILSR